MTISRNSWITAVLALAVAGCSSDTMPKAEVFDTVTASGTATYNGKPLEFYQVNFVPDAGKRNASGMVDAEGKFTLGTNAPGDGAIAGPGTISIVYVGPPLNVEPGREDPSMKVPPPKVKIPAKYADPKKSGLTFTVPEGGTTEMKLELKD